jgi:hypothetical protein
LDEEFDKETDKKYEKVLIDKALFKDKAMRLALIDSVCRTHYTSTRDVKGTNNTWKIMQVL